MIIASRRGPGLQRVFVLRDGFSLIEIMVAMTLLSVVLLALGALSIQTSRRGALMTLGAQRNAAMAAQVNQLSSLPFDSLAGRAGCTTIATAPYPRTQCVIVTIVSPRQRRVMIVIQPSAPALRPDTSILIRTRPQTGSPFKA